MATDIALHDCAEEEEDYIDMELSSSQQNRDFEFQMSLTCNDHKQANASPADELFYKGKLLPLHLPPRRLMVQNLLGITNKAVSFDITSLPFEEDHSYPTPFTTAPCTDTTNTPLDISPSESPRVSCELNRVDHFFDWSTDLGSFVGNQPTKKQSWSKKLKLIKKLKASRAYLKSLFTKPACSVKANYGAEVADNLPKGDGASKRYFSKKSCSTVDTAMASTGKEGTEGNNIHRRSFSGAFKRDAPTKCLSSSSSNSSSADSSSSSSFSYNPSGFNERRILRRSNSATEIEGSIEAAIDHCKKSQQIFDSRSSVRVPGICAL